jgi:hypothetical protein
MFKYIINNVSGLFLISLDKTSQVTFNENSAQVWGFSDAMD